MIKRTPSSIAKTLMQYSQKNAHKVREILNF